MAGQGWAWLAEAGRGRAGRGKAWQGKAWASFSDEAFEQGAIKVKPSTGLKRARKLIAKPNGWTQKEWARDKNGHGVDAIDRSAKCFCALGACWRVTGSDNEAMENTLIKYLRRAIGGTVNHWNDRKRRTQAQVVKAFDKAIKLAEADGQ
jgi:hypothetical protein